jgi:glycerol-3-phosphate dehydrogenase subunit C
MSREGSLEAPTRHPIAWQSEDYYDKKKLDAEMRRIFDVCHGCRRCFNLCESFPRLFDLVDASPSEEVDGVKSEDFGKVVEACTLCDMCFMTKCPYVPPHPFNVDFPHLMLRHRVVEGHDSKTGFTARQLAETDRNGKIGGAAAPVVNWASKRTNGLTRPLMEKTLGIDAHANLPKFHSRTFMRASRSESRVNTGAPAFGKRKAALYATCFVNYNKPTTGMAARAVLHHAGVATKSAYPGCCGMPMLEQAKLPRVAEQAEKVSKALCALIDEGYDIVTLTASCGLMLKFEWPLILPENAEVKRVAEATYDIAEYVVEIAKQHGLPDGMKPVESGVSVHMACHARAQNMGAKAAEMLRLIPGTPVDVIERCSGHGGTFGVLKETHGVAMKVGRPAMRQLVGKPRGHVVSDCPLAAAHLVQGARELAAKDGKEFSAEISEHPIEILAQSYGLTYES